MLHLQTACGIPAIGAKQKESKMVRYFDWSTILQHYKHRGLAADENDDNEDTDELEQPMFIDGSSSSSERDAPAAKVQCVVFLKKEEENNKEKEQKKILSSSMSS